MKNIDTLEWNDSQVIQLTSLWAAGFTAEQIRQSMGTTRSAICGKVRRLMLPLRVKHITERKPAHAPYVKQPKPEPIPEEVLEPCEPVQLTDLESHHCAYPLWGDDVKSDDGFLCCGRRREAGSYCRAHARRCYTPIRPRKVAA